ncbi:MAG TPA: heme-binding protein [Rhodospirillales bacterium]|jgi:uncharacterized protein GlcG (DUF336 family)|nr:heme-binding protein [Rhodospirillales bacterium]
MLGRYLAAGAVLATLSSPVQAQEGALITFKTLTLEAATELAQGALAECRKRGFQVAVAVVDRGGNVQVMLRDRFAGPHTTETARRKAWTAVSFHTDTQAMATLTQPGELVFGTRQIPGALMLGGGVPIEAGGSIVGGVGVSGAPGGDSDDACARAGIEAIFDKLEF